MLHDGRHVFPSSGVRIHPPYQTLKKERAAREHGREQEGHHRRHYLDSLTAKALLGGGGYLLNEPPSAQYAVHSSPIKPISTCYTINSKKNVREDFNLFIFFLLFFF